MTQPRSRSLHGSASPRARWARRHKAAAALLPALVLVLAIGITVRTLGARHPAGRPPGHAAAAPELAAATRGAKWVTGPAGQLLQTVNADLGRLAAGERAGRRDVAQSASSRLAAASRAALNGPMPPVDAKIYRSALKGFKRAGIYITHGKFSKADILLNTGDSDIAKVTSAANHPAKVSHRDAVKEPNGQ
jgi:hypothetical protein